MHFLFPAFLFGLISLAIPVFIHLFQMRRYTRVYFSNVQFLRSVQQKESSRKKLKQRVILIIRMLALASLVFAFSKPFIPSKDGNVFGQQAVSIFLDNSYSMETINREGTLLNEARRRAKELASNYGINDRFQLLTHDFEGSHQRLLTRQEFNDEVDQVKISSKSRNLQQIIDRQQSLLDMRSGDKKRIFIISDFQRNLVPLKSIITSASIPITLVKLKAGAFPNLTVDTAWFISAVHNPGNNEKLVITLHNYADEKSEGVPVKVLINGIQKSLGSFSVNARSLQNDTLNFSGLEAGWQNVEIQVQDNPITFDNHFYLTFNVRQQMPLLVIDGEVQNKYIAAVFNADSFFKPKMISYGNVDYANLPTYPLIILTDIKSIPTGLAQQINIYVKNGGTLCVFPADGADLPSYKALLQPLGANYPSELASDMGKVSTINLQSRLFQNTFAREPKSPDLPMVMKYYKFGDSKGSLKEILFEMPGKRPLLADYFYGKGLVYLSAVPLNVDYSNLPNHSLFVPLMLRIALLSGHDGPLFYTIGLNEEIETAPIQASDKSLIKLVGPSTVIIPDIRRQGRGTQLYFADQLNETGSYKLVKQDSVISELAFNNSRSESDLSYLSDNELKGAMQNQTNIVLSNTESTTSKQAVISTGLGLELWKICLLLSLICLGAEILLVRFFQPPRKKEALTT